MIAAIKWILFDLDNTLLDFSGASKAAFQKTFQDHGLALHESYYPAYSVINHKLWSDFEDNLVTAEQIRELRFTRLFDELQIKDMSGIAFNADYLNNLVDLSESYAGVVELLEQLSKKYTLSIVTNGLREVQRPRLEKTGISHYFKSIIVSDEIGVSKPDRAFFDQVYRSVEDPPRRSEILIVGDSLRSDIRGGHEYGIQTCWIAHGQENKTELTPDYAIDTVMELPALLDG